jgi:molybdopterin converting factor small subunit
VKPEGLGCSSGWQRLLKSRDIHWFFLDPIIFDPVNPGTALAHRLGSTTIDRAMYVEFLGVPRQRAGVTELTVEARTLGQLLETLSTRLPSLSALIVGDRLHPSFTANLNGDEFISDPRTPLREDDCVLILSADAGG